MKYTPLLVLVLCILNSCKAPQTDIDLTLGWKISPGDNPAWSDPAFDDSQWDTISAGQPWEDTVLPGYDGIAWYRKSFIVPGSMKKGLTAGQQDLILKLGQIDDASEIFWNGEKICSTGDFSENDGESYRIHREVSIPVDLVNWNELNHIAVRINDFGGGGGMIAGAHALLSSDWTDYVEIQSTFIDNETQIYSEGDSVKVQIELRNSSGNAYKIRAKLMFLTDQHEGISSHWRTVRLAPESSELLEFSTEVFDPGFYEFTYECSVKGRQQVEKGVDYYGCDPELINAGMTRPDDFEEYWSRAIYELSLVQPEFNMTPVTEHNTDKYEVFDVEMRSWGNVRVNGWYARPRKPGKHPALVMQTGYSWSMPPQTNMEGFAILGFNIRGHGNSVKDVDPGFPQYIVTNITEPEQYIYKGAYMDVIRAVDFLCTRPEIDTSRIGVYGGSQGGALSFASAALDKRIKACAPHIPFLSDFREYFKIADFPRGQFDQFLFENPEVTWTQLYNTLDYIDIKNLAPWIGCPILMGVGLRDQVCPPYTNFAAFNNVSSEDKEYFIYPGYGHSVPQSHKDYELKWFREKLAITD